MLYIYARQNALQKLWAMLSAKDFTIFSCIFLLIEISVSAVEQDSYCFILVCSDVAVDKGAVLSQFLRYAHCAVTAIISDGWEKCSDFSRM